MACTFVAERKKQFSVLFRLLKRNNFSPPSKMNACTQEQLCALTSEGYAGESVHGKTDIALLYIYLSILGAVSSCLQCYFCQAPLTMHELQWTA